MFLLLFIVWIILNGRLTLETALIGITVVSLIYFFLFKFMNVTPKSDLCAFKISFLLLEYFLVLCGEIIKANLAMLPLSLGKTDAASPIIVSFETDLSTQFARVLLADSITLTPGTITVKLEGSRYTVHCLTEELSRGLSESVFVRLLKKMEAAL